MLLNLDSVFHLPYDQSLRSPFFQLRLIALYVSSVFSAAKDPRLYSCPVYKKSSRTDLNYIAAMDLKTRQPPEHWVLRGVALLCDVK